MALCKEGCERVARSRGWCSSHCRRWLAGKPLDRRPKCASGGLSRQTQNSPLPAATVLWGDWDLNPGPTDYESAALTN